MSASPAAACQNHPSREAIGVCVECRARICTECVTKVDGINHCVACYVKVADRQARVRPDARDPGAASAGLAAAAWLATLSLALWMLLEVSFP